MLDHLAEQCKPKTPARDRHACFAPSRVASQVAASVASLAASLVASSVVLVPVIAVLSVPARSAIWYGQDQLWLLALVLVDLFVVPRRWTGILTGLVVSVSFWPAIFVAAIFRGWCGFIMVLAGTLYLLAGCANHFNWMLHLYQRFPSLL